MSVASSQWFLLKFDDATVFGPVPFSQLREWADTAQISPFDKISTDNQTWIKAPMLPELEMDWLVELTADRLYGPTTLGAIREFRLVGELSDTTVLINASDGSTYPLAQVIGEIEPDALPKSALLPDAPSTVPPPITPAQAGIRVSLQQRIRELETALLEERRAHDTLEARYRKLSDAYLHAVGAPAPF